MQKSYNEDILQKAAQLSRNEHRLKSESEEWDS